MKLYDLLIDVDVIEIIGEDTTLITGLSDDTRKITAGYLFVAVKGVHTDGHRYIAKAEEMGAKAIVCQEIPPVLKEGVVYIRVSDSSVALGKIASSFYGHPSEKLTLVGVTGTNGKTTIATLLYDLFSSLGYKCGLLSTVCNYIVQEKVPATHTTPDPISLHSLLAQMVDKGCTHAFMEVSSHAIDQNRISGLLFDGGIFTNLTRDHLDYHKTVEAYLYAKKRFFDQLSADAFALTNIDDKNGSVMLQNTRASKFSYSLKTLANFKAKILESHFDGMMLLLNQREVSVGFIGKFNAYNLLAVVGAAVLLGEDLDKTLLHLSLLHPVSGRLETLYSPSGWMAIVDYAHTPDALENVISTINAVREGPSRLITIIGCGGNRDKGKRPLMAKEAVKGSDKVILTSDNPRDEQPDAILEDMWSGVEIHQRKRVLRIVDRKEAIRTACLMAQKGDIVLVAGKGHEDYQEIEGVKYPFDDKKVLTEIFQEISQ